MKNLILRLFRNEKGDGLIEYGIIAALIAIVVIGAVKTLGTNDEATFNNTSTSGGAVSGGGGGGPSAPPAPVGP